MSRIPGHTIDDAPPASRPLLEGVIKSSPIGRPLNLHAQMAHSPAVLDAYTSLRRATAVLGTLEQRVRAALMLAAAGRCGNDYALVIISRLAVVAGWGEDEVRSLRTGLRVDDDKIDSLVDVVREAAGASGRVTDATWTRALSAGWSDEQLTEAFAYLGLTVFTAYFLNYAETEIDLALDAPAA